MADDFPITTAQIVGLFMECICYGTYLVTLAQCLRSLFWSDAEHSFKKKINWPMLTVTLSMALVATLHVAVGLRQNLDAFVYSTGQGGAAAEFSNISSWSNVMKTAGYVAQTIIGDGMLTYRCYLVYDRKWYFAAPSFILWIAGSTCGLLVIAIFATLHTETSIDASQGQPYIYSALALTIAMNTLTTSLIVYRIWSVDRQTARMGVRPYGVTRLTFTIRILIESAALYTISVIVLVGTYIADSNANYGTSFIVVQLIGISFNSIIVRINSGRSYEGSTKFAIRAPLSTFHACSVKSLATTDGPLVEVGIQRESMHDA